PASLVAYALSLRDALPISVLAVVVDDALGVRGQDDPGAQGSRPRLDLLARPVGSGAGDDERSAAGGESLGGGVDPVGVRCRQRSDRKSTRLNSSHVSISYA